MHSTTGKRLPPRHRQRPKTPQRKCLTKAQKSGTDYNYAKLAGVSVALDVVANLLKNFIVPGEELHGPRARFGAAFSGCLILHLAVLLRESTQVYFLPTLEFALFTGVVVLFVCALFGLLISVGVAKGSLVRHYLYGVILPVITYVLGSQAGSALFIVGNLDATT